MRYMIMMNIPAGGGAYQTRDWAPEDLQANMTWMMDLDRELREAGEWVAGEALTAPGQAKLVRAGKDGAPVTDGPFPETKEFLAGYWIVDVDTPERVYQIAARTSAAPGPGGIPLNIPIEVREVMRSPSPDHCVEAEAATADA